MAGTSKHLKNLRSPTNPLAQAIHKYDEMVDASSSDSILQDSKHLPHCNHALTLYNLNKNSRTEMKEAWSISHWGHEIVEPLL